MPSVSPRLGCELACRPPRLSLRKELLRHNLHQLSRLFIRSNSRRAAHDLRVIPVFAGPHRELQLLGILPRQECNVRHLSDLL
jgi:hypothetical protein